MVANQENFPSEIGELAATVEELFNGVATLEDPSAHGAQWRLHAFSRDNAADTFRQ